MRDKLSEIIKSNGGEYKVRALKQEEYKKELLKKIKEEAQKVLEAGNDKKELTKKPVMFYRFCITQSQLSGWIWKRWKEKDKAQKTRGTLDEKLFLEYTYD